MNGQAMGGPTVASTVVLAGAGDEAAFAQLVATYHADMARVAFVACGDRELAEDAVQSAWLVAWRKLRYDATADRWEILVEADPGGSVPVLEVYDPLNRRFVGWRRFATATEDQGEVFAFDPVTREWTVLLEPSEEQHQP